MLLGLALLALGIVAVGPKIGDLRTNNLHTDDLRTGDLRTSAKTEGRPRMALASVPDDAPELGLVYEGLRPATADTPCAGAYEMLTPATCTHGPDPVPAGLRVSRDVPAVTKAAAPPRAPRRESGQTPPDAQIVEDQGGTSPTPGGPVLVPDAAPGEADFVMGRHGVACEGDGHAGNRVQVLYLHESGAPSRYAEYLGSIRAWSAGADAIIDASAGETGGSRHIRFVTTPQCQVEVAEVQVPTRALASFKESIAALGALGYNRTDRKYLIFADANVYCGIGTFIGDRRPGAGNRNNGGPSYGRVDAGCWNAAMATRELVYTLGASMLGAPNSTGPGRCSDDYDLLCGPTTAAASTRTVCGDKRHELLLDCNHDDYFHTNPPPGSYLAKNWNVAQSQFLLRSDGGEDLPVDVPVEPPAATPTPAVPPAASPSSAPSRPGDPAPTSASPSASSPSPDPYASAPSSAPAAPEDRPAIRTEAVLEIRDATSTSMHLSWSAASPTALYEVLVDGTAVGRTGATRAHLIGLRPDSAYRVTIRGLETEQKYTADAAGRTTPAARPAPNSWFVLTNSLTAGAADLYAARTANGAPIVLSDADGGAQQQWKLVPAEDGTFALQSRATGKCVVPQGGKPAVGVPLVQADCTSDSSQRWAVEMTDHGFSLRTTVGGLVVGAGTQRFGTHRLLVLQEPDGTRHQSWTALPA